MDSAGSAETDANGGEKSSGVEKPQCKSGFVPCQSCGARILLSTFRGRGVDQDMSELRRV
jgi:hypothetical protein